MSGGRRAGARGPRLVMLSGSYVDHDARVLKSAGTAAAAGFDVTVVAPSPTGTREDVDRGGWVLSVVPVGQRARREATRPRLLGRLGYADEERARLARAALERSAGRIDARATRTDVRGAVPGSVRGAVSRGARGVLGARRWVVDERTVVMRYRQARRWWNEPWARPVVTRALRMPGLRDWRRLVPESLDLDEAFAPVVDALDPEILHSHDVQTVNVAAGAAARAAAHGHPSRWIYDAHEHVIGLTAYPPDRLVGLVELEAAFIGRADGVMTVCDPIADSLRHRFGLPVRPSVVLNAPLLAPSHAEPGARRLHEDAGLPPDTPVVVYSGKVDAARGIDDLAGALVHLPPAVHVVLVTDRSDRYLAQTRDRLAAAGCADRFRTVPYVAPEELVGYLAGASLGFAGFSPIGNHQVSLPNKFFDYLHAGLPMVVTDLELLGPLVRDLRVGRVYPFGNARALAAVITQMLADRQQFLPALHDPALRRRYSWQAQEPVLLDLYRSLSG